jgi:FkbM family methyltransferase
MTNLFSSFAKKRLFGKGRNLVSLDDPFEVMTHLLKGHLVSGIMDAGASDGRISKRLLRKFPHAQVYAFEPNPLYTAELRQYAEEDSRFCPQFLALSDSEGTAALHITESPGNTSLLTPGQRLRDIDCGGAAVKADEKVELVTIDNWAKHNGDLSIELMKFDIQGAELKALRGAARMLANSTLIVYTEVCFNPLYEGGTIFSEIDLFLRDYGFGLYDIYKPKYNSQGLIMWANAIFVNFKRLAV